MKTTNYILLSLLFFLIVLLFPSCIKEPEDLFLKYSKASGLFIVNEGSFTYGNASLSFYDPETKEVLNDVFYGANAFPVGDALQSISFRDSIGYLCVSNSGKILLFNTNTFLHMGTISGLGSPRSIEIVDKNKAYVSDLYSPYLTIVDPEKLSITGSVKLGNSSESFLRYGDLLFINSWSYNNKIYVLNSLNDELLDSITVSKQPNSMCMDKNNKLWVLSDGGYEGTPYGQVKAALTRIDADNFSVEKIYEFNDISDSPFELNINKGRDSLFFIGGGWASAGSIKKGIFVMGIDDENLPGEAYITGNGDPFYALAIDPENSQIYGSVALDFLQRGYVYSFTAKGIPVDTIKVGIAPGGFGFKRDY